MSKSRPVLMLSCEHGGNDIPQEYKRLFRGASGVLKSHRGWDPGALELAKSFAATWKVPLFSTTTSRLLVELNRSARHPVLFSEFTRDLPPAEKVALLAEYYWPYREQIEQYLETCLRQSQQVIHIGVHTFTPVLHGETRNADVGILYDPRHGSEQDLAHAWRASLRTHAPDLRVRLNYPYRGAADGLTTHLRRRFGERYAGIELEVNQHWPLMERRQWPDLQRALATSLDSLVGKRANFR